MRPDALKSCWTLILASCVCLAVLANPSDCPAQVKCRNPDCGRLLIDTPLGQPCPFCGKVLEADNSDAQRARERLERERREEQERLRREQRERAEKERLRREAGKKTAQADARRAVDQVLDGAAAELRDRVTGNPALAGAARDLMLDLRRATANGLGLPRLGGLRTAAGSPAVQAKVAQFNMTCKQARQQYLNNCSGFVRKAAEQMGYKLPQKNANQLVDYFETKESGWVAVDEDTAQALADVGELVVAGKKNPTGSGHVVVVAPGGKAHSGGYQYVDRKTGKTMTARDHGEYPRMWGTGSGTWPGVESEGEKSVYDAWGSESGYKGVKYWKSPAKKAQDEEITP